MSDDNHNEKKNNHHELISITEEFVKKLSGLSDINYVNITISCSDAYLRRDWPVKMAGNIIFQNIAVMTDGALSNSMDLIINKEKH